MSELINGNFTSAECTVPKGPFRQSHAAKFRSAELTIARTQSVYDRGARAAVLRAMLRADVGALPALADVAAHWVAFMAAHVAATETWQGGRGGHLVGAILEFVPDLGRDAATTIGMLADAQWSRRRADALEEMASTQAVNS